MQSSFLSCILVPTTQQTRQASLALIPKRQSRSWRALGVQNEKLVVLQHFRRDPAMGTFYVEGDYSHIAIGNVVSPASMPRGLYNCCRALPYRLIMRYTTDTCPRPVLLIKPTCCRSANEGCTMVAPELSGHRHLPWRC